MSHDVGASFVRPTRLAVRSVLRRTAERFFARPPTLGPLLAIALILLATQFIALHAMGRAWWCRCREPSLWVGNVLSEHNSQHLLDPYSFSHVMHGVIFYAMLRHALPAVSVRWRFVIATLIEIAWELAENSPFIIARYRQNTASLGYVGDSIANSLGDSACAMLGFALAGRLPWPASLALLFTFELIGLLWIRDSLTLNVVMLVHPIDAIREWQMRLGPA